MDPVCNVKASSRLYEGAEHTVFPVVALVEGVHNGVFYSKAEIAKFPSAWNNRPVPLYHPEDATGKKISANSPDVLEQYRVGSGFNFMINENGALCGELWINNVKALEKDPDLLIKMQDNMEISTCLWTDGDGVSGNWNGEDFTESVFNFRPDHVAILPEQTGACSWRDGCGVRANEQIKHEEEVLALLKSTGLCWNDITSNAKKDKKAFEEVQSNIHAFLNGIDYKEGDNYVYHFLEATYDSYFIYGRSPTRTDPSYRFYRRDYSVDESGKAVIDNESKEMVKKTTFEQVTTNAEDKEEQTMGQKKSCCPDRVEALIANAKSPYTDDDRDHLLTMNEEKFAAVEKPYVEEEPKPETKVKANSGDTPEVKLEVKSKEIDVNTFISSAPPEIQALLNSGLETYQKQKGAAIDHVMTNAAGVYEKAELEAMDLKGLSRLVALVSANKPAPQRDLGLPIYPGRGIAPSTLSSVKDETPLALSAGSMVDEPKK